VTVREQKQGAVALVTDYRKQSPGFVLGQEFDAGKPEFVKCLTRAFCNADKHRR